MDNRRNHPLFEKVLATIQRYNLLKAGDNVCVALSGGADSVALVYLMTQLMHTLELESVCALHVHHGLRGEEADRDEAYVRTLCKKLRVPLHVKHADVRSHAALHHQSLEEAGREVRYAFFEEHASQVSNSKIATAHTQSDVAETVLLHLSRGCGLQGASGIPVKRRRIVRPLIDCSADEIRDFCNTFGLHVCVDSTNGNVSFSRNRIRHAVLPHLERINPDASRSIARFAELAREENRFLDELATALYEQSCTKSGLSIATLRRADPVLTRRALILAVQARGIRSLEQRHVSALLSLLETDGTVNLPKNHRACAQNGFIRFDRIRVNPIAPIPQTLLTPPEQAFFGDTAYELRLISKNEYIQLLNVHKNLFDFCLSYDMIINGLCWRPRKEGDWFRPAGRRCSKSLKKWFQEADIPPNERDRIPVICDDQGILAILGHAVDERVAITDSTATVLWFRKLSE